MDGMRIAFLRDEGGQDLIEYGLLASFLSVSAIAVLRIFGGPIVAMFQLVLDALS
jgi:Flp pilus assembly pilin Flp